MSILARRALTTVAALILAFTALAIQTPSANADPVCAEASYTAVGFLSDDLGGCESTSYDTFFTFNTRQGNPDVVEVSVYINLVLP